MAQVVKNPITKAGDTRDMGLIPGSRSPGEGNGNPVHLNPWLHANPALLFLHTHAISIPAGPPPGLAVPEVTSLFHSPQRLLHTCLTFLKPLTHPSLFLSDNCTSLLKKVGTVGEGILLHSLPSCWAQPASCRAAL